jgi:hypothetical protein
MDSKSIPALISVPVVQAAGQRAHAAVRPRQLNKYLTKATPTVVAFFYGENFGGRSKKLLI